MMAQYTPQKNVYNKIYDTKNYNVQGKLIHKQYWNITQINIMKNMNWFIIN